MNEFWEEAFKSKQEMWGLQPTTTAVLSATAFAEMEFQKILIPGIGYGRNAQPFLSKGMIVTGIEISGKAIELAIKHYGKSIEIHHGSVTDMPFDNKKYDAVFSHALIHLLDENQRNKFIQDCYNQLEDGGYMFFTAITKDAKTYGQGRLISIDRYEQFGGVNMFFYDEKSIQNEFEEYGLVQIETIIENYPFYLIKCKK
ncbi:class I SAM-dependent methyltransferase [Sphingobacterium corticibacter]|uniref:SAM-dependent methyltransferase n=1 Tax=Sphingobacterium corticibacter TaxID=2171749 RepID=A0A2T8HGF2_9SPHI|nr:class I SAM-dependent methyltransferase [Sphingobacterium corticibacter]PVH24516.1 SAM-dependent methyltransferase [Sphingobacterium corticibacter]